MSDNNTVTNIVEGNPIFNLAMKITGEGEKQPAGKQPQKNSPSTSDNPQPVDASGTDPNAVTPPQADFDPKKKKKEPTTSA